MVDVDVQATSGDVMTIIDVDGPGDIAVVDTGGPSSVSLMSSDFGVESSSDVLSSLRLWSSWVSVDLPIIPLLCHLCHLRLNY